MLPGNTSSLTDCVGRVAGRTVQEGRGAGRVEGGGQCDNDKEDHVTSLVVLGRWFGCGDKGMIKGVP